MAHTSPAAPPTAPVRYVLLPGRHHLLTRYQAQWLARLLDGRARDLDGEPVAVDAHTTVVWALTSANHTNTRRNPVPGHRREAAIERFSLTEGIRSVVVPIVDTAPTDRFADLTVKTVLTATGLALTPDNTVVACSTPAVIDLYRALGYRIAGVELDTEPTPLRPWAVLDLLVDGDDAWRDLAHPASVDVYDRYRLAEAVRMVSTDPIVGSEGSLTETRAYGTYAASFESASDRKWAQVAPHVEPGRMVDIGCATGGLLRRAGAEPRLHESDLIGVEVARHLYAEAEHLKAQGAFPNPNTFFYQRNILAPEPVFPERSIDTTLTIALTHEIISYGDGLSDLRRLADAVFAHTRPGGVWINSDVCGPADPDRLVDLTLEDGDGVSIDAARRDLDALAGPEVEAYVAGLSTRSRMLQFAHDFARLAHVDFPVELTGSTARLRLADAMEFMTRKDYTDNWLSECHERFTALTWSGWQAEAARAGFEVDPASHAWRNDWLVEHRFTPTASLADAATGEPLDWPDTHVLLVARRPALS